jgi:WD40 repeat protein
MRILIVISALLLSVSLAAQPVARTPLAGSSFDLNIKGDRILASTSGGTVEALSWGEEQSRRFVALEAQAGDFGPAMPRIYSADQNASGTLALIYQGAGGLGRALALQHPDGTMRELVGAQQRRSFRKVRFVAPNRLFVMGVGGVAWLFDTASGEALYQKPVMGYAFSDFVLSPDRTQVALTGESGAVVIVAIESGEVVKRLTGGSRDNAYSIDWKGGVIATAGQDRRLSLYDVAGTSVQHIDTDFLISAVALSPSGSQVAYVCNEASDIALYDRKADREIARLTGHFAMVGHIAFVDEKRLISGGDDSYLLHWRLP